MKRIRFDSAPIVSLNALLLAAVLFARVVHGQVLVGYNPNGGGVGGGLVADYSTSGQLINPSFLSTPWLTYPAELALDGNRLFVLDHVNGWISQFDASSGADLNPLFIKTTGGYGMCGDGQGGLYISSPGSGAIAKYSTSGSLINGSLVTGLNMPVAVATQGGLLYAVNTGTGTVGQYTTAGSPRNGAFASGLESSQCAAVDAQGNVYIHRNVSEWGLNCIDKYSSSGALLQQNVVVLAGIGLVGMAVSGNDLYVLESTGTVAEYTTSGTLLNSALITGLAYPESIYVVPEPSAGALAVLGLGLAAGSRRFIKRVQATH